MRLSALVLVFLLPAAQEESPADTQIVVHSFRNAFGRLLISEWQTWVLDLENKLGRDVELTLRIEDSPARLQVTRHETMPRAARKRLFFYLPAGVYARGLGSQPRYEILDSRGRKLRESVASESLAVSDVNAFQIGLFSKDLSSTNAFGLPQEITGRTPLAVARLSSATFPGRWTALACLDAIVVHDAPLDELSLDQAQALADYVRAGGTVILSPGPDSSGLTHKVLKPFVSIRCGKSERRTDLPDMNRAFGAFRGSESFFLHSVEGGKELGWKREALLFDSGFGRVVVLPFDIRRAPFDAWPGMEKLWLSLLNRIPGRVVKEVPAAHPAATAEQRLSLFQSIALLINPYPSFILLLALAVLFIAAIGPVNYLMLRKLGMTLLIVVTVPAISLGFLGLVLGIGYVVKGTTTVAYSARFLSTRSGLDCARETQLFTLFSPSTRSYEVTTAPGTSGLPLERAGLAEARYYYRRGEREVERVDCVDGAAFAYTSVSVGQWQSWNLEARALRGFEGGVRFEPMGEIVRVTNHSPFTIERGLYLESSEVSSAIPFGEIAPGKTVDVPLVRGRTRPFEDLGLSRETFAGRMLGPTLEPFATARPLRSIVQPVRPSLLCILKEEEPPVKVDARLSGDSRSLTVLHVAEREAP